MRGDELNIERLLMDKVGETIRWAFDEQKEAFKEKIAILEKERDGLAEKVGGLLKARDALEDKIDEFKDKISELEGEIDDLNAPGQGPEDARDLSRYDNNPGVALIEKRFDGSFGCAWCGRDIAECHERMEEGKCREMP